MIDEHTLKALEFEKVKDRVASYATSTLGREEIGAISPTDDLDAIREELQLVFEFADLISFDDPVPIRGIKDLSEPLRRCTVEGISLSPEDFLKLRDTLIVSRLLQRYLVKRQEKSPLLSGLAEQLVQFPKLEDKLEEVFDPKGKIKDSASHRLAQIRRGIIRAREDLKQKLEAILKDLPLDVVQDRIVTIRDGRFVIPIRESQRRRLEGVVHDQSDSGATLFVEPLATVESNNHLRQLEMDEKRETDKILRELTDEVRDCREGLLGNVKILGRLDSIYAKASFAVDFNATKPILNESGKTIIRKGRHPILVQRLRESGEKDSVVPLDLKIGENFTTLVITGPNAGGKTVALKTIGLLTLMAQAGLPITADENSEISVFEKIFADIGDEQSIENDLSSFSSHIRQLNKVCREADDKALVLLDELGASTDPDEGSALAMSVLESLNQRGTRAVATTHHSALKLFAHEHPGMENGSMQFDLAKLKPTFKLRLGIPGSSYAFEIAERLGMSVEIVSQAALYAGGESRKLESLIVELERKRQDYDEKSLELERAKADVDEVVSKYRRKLEGVQEEKRRLKEEALLESRRILEQANAIVERVVAEIRTKQASREAIKAGKSAIRDSLTSTDRQLRPFSRPKEAPDLQAGDKVWIESFGKEGKVLSQGGASGRVQVQVGKVKVEVYPSELKAIKKSEEETERISSGFASPSPSPSIPTQIDLRGMTFDEASAVVDKYLDDAFLASLNTVTIIHGKGTGALREKIGNFLRSHPRVKSQRLGAWNEGGSGVTIVEINH